MANDIFHPREVAKLIKRRATDQKRAAGQPGQRPAIFAPAATVSLSDSVIKSNYTKKYNNYI